EHSPRPHRRSRDLFSWEGPGSSMSLLAAPAPVALPDGTFIPGPLMGDQQPRFWTAPPRHRVKDPDCRTCQLGTAYACGCGDYQSAVMLDWAAGHGYDLDPWQSWWLTEATGVKPDGHWAAFETLLICTRQNWKNQCLEVRELAGMFLFGESMLIHTAHEFKAAAEHFRRVRDTVTAYDALRKRVKSVTTSHGDEAIELMPKPTLIFGSGGRQVRRNIGARLRFLARSRGSGRSFTADFLAYDEAMILSDDVVGASMPTMRAVPNPQMAYTASAGYPDSVQLAMVRRRVQRQDPSLMGAEWSILPHLDTCPRDEIRGRKDNRYVVCGLHDDRDDPRSWARANPAFGTRIRLEHFRQEMAAMSPGAFDRELLGVGDWPAEDEAWAVVTEEAWRSCEMPDPGGAVRPVAFAIDIDPEMNAATIASAWQRPATPAELQVPGARPYRTVLEIPRGCSRDGTAWIIPRLAELRRAWRPIAIAIPKNGPAAGLIDEAANAGLEIMTASSADEAAAFAAMVTAVRERAVGHLGRERAPGLWSAVASAETRDIGDGGRAWSRRESGSDITPVTAVTLAAWALGKKRRSYDPMRSVR
ncbi:MAG TPA: hypothetical protein VNH17_07870, partial [Streptosporangiaceae bacterium]|nr:hypothetical protein [Streptosporangiaceae bacterium]